MKLSLIINIFISLSTVSGIGGLVSNEIKYEQKPPQPYEFTNIHQFTNTPFQELNYTNFLNKHIDESTAVTFQDVNELNKEIRPLVLDLTKENFFRIFRLNLFKECPFWSGDGFCIHQSCAVDTIDDWEDLPQIWQPEALGKLADSPVVRDMDDTTDGCIVSGNDSDYCDLDGFNEDSVYVDLVANPERFTGYGGDQSWQIWKSVYNENCFNLGHDQCVEKNFFYKLISGMHASISTHLSNEYLDKHEMKYVPNLQQFMFRVGNYPERIQNIYLNYIILLKSLIKLDSFGVLDNLEFCEDLNFKNKELELKEEIKDILKPIYKFSKGKNECLFDEDILFQGEESTLVKQEIKENFRNITRIMDCVHCDRCRLWGKLQTTGYGTALKVLFELNDKQDFNIDLSKVELIALINTFDRLSKSVASINHFKQLYDEAIFKEESGESIMEEDSSSTLDDLFNIAPKKKKVEKVVGTPDIFKDELELFDDVIYPYQSEGGSLKDVFYLELRNVYEAWKFVLRSYFIFPKVVYNWCLIRMVYYWNMFVGHVQEDFDFNRLYQIEI